MLPSNSLWFNPPHQNKKSRPMMTSFVYFGGAEGDRTPDPKTASGTLVVRNHSLPFPFLAFSYACIQDLEKVFRILSSVSVLS
jgi:hypothetical protein